jgi:phosphate transport system substrate-binding protein
MKLMNLKHRTTALTLVMSSLVGSLLSARPALAVINGAGATFPYPLYSKWFSEYQKLKPEVQINYQSIGSGGGIRQFLEGTVDFGASDAPMSEEQLAKAKAGALHIPTALGAVVLTYNITGVTGSLKLTGPIVADIFLGKTKSWNDPAIVKENPGVALPSSPILVVHRSDGSGTSQVFTDYLSKVSPEWKSKVGAATAVNWPVGLGGKGNEGVTSLVKQTPGAIGYVELIYAENNKLQVAQLKNKSGAFVTPSAKSVTAAAAGALKNMPADFRVSITESEGKDSYPISAFTYLLISQKLPAGEKSQQLVGFLNWAVTDGQKFAEKLTYAPLPAPLVPKVAAKIKTIRIE